MLAEQLDVTLLVRPEVPYARIAAALAGLGHARREGVRSAAPPLLPGEEEIAAWTTRGGARITYTFDPSVRLRRLDVADLAPAERAAIAAALPLLEPGEVTSLLASRDPEERLRGVRAAVTTERVDLLGALDALVGEDEVVVSDAAASAFATLERAVYDRTATLFRLSLLARDARALILRLPGEPAAVAALRPTRADAEAACGEHADRALAHAERMYAPPPVIPPTGTALDVVAATGALLRGPNEISAAFATGWRDAAGRLRPEGVWVTWRQLPAQVRFDGLFHAGEGRWVWFPKLWRALRDD